MSLLSDELRVLAVGAPLFAETLESQAVEVQRVEWQPPADGNAELGGVLTRLWRDDVDSANELALRRVLDARQVLVDVRPAGEVVPGLQPNMVLHAGPPIEWERMTAPVRAAAIGAILHEGLASTQADAEHMAARGEIRFEPCHH